MRSALRGRPLLLLSRLLSFAFRSLRSRLLVPSSGALLCSLQSLRPWLCERTSRRAPLLLRSMSCREWLRQSCSRALLCDVSSPCALLCSLPSLRLWLPERTLRRALLSLWSESGRERLRRACLLASRWILSLLRDRSCTGLRKRHGALSILRPPFGLLSCARGVGTAFVTPCLRSSLQLSSFSRLREGVGAPSWEVAPFWRFKAAWYLTQSSTDRKLKTVPSGLVIFMLRGPHACRSASNLHV